MVIGDTKCCPARDMDSESNIHINNCHSYTAYFVRIVCRFFTSYSIIVILVGYFIHAVMVLSEVRLHSDSQVQPSTEDVSEIQLCMVSFRYMELPVGGITHARSESAFILVPLLCAQCAVFVARYIPHLMRRHIDRQWVAGGRRRQQMETRQAS